MKRPLDYLIVLSGLLTGCATTKTSSLAIPSANIASVYEPPSKTRVSAEIVVAVLLIALILYIIFEAVWFKKPQKGLP